MGLKMDGALEEETSRGQISCKLSRLRPEVLRCEVSKVDGVQDVLDIMIM